MRSLRWTIGLILAIAIGATVHVFPQTGASSGTVERVKAHGKGLEGNLAGDAADREVSVYLPPGYREGNRRYPVIYMLHGFTDDDARWYGIQKHWINLPLVIDKALAGGEARETIVVTPNAFTRYQGSMYSNSVTTGNWEAFVADELVAHIDRHYRTIAAAASRGLAGHSMGGYGALRIGMKRPDVFSSVYLLNPCCLTPNTGLADGKRIAEAEAVRTPEQIEKVEFLTKALLASGAAWSPNPRKPPLFLDLPWVNGALQAEIVAKWAANAPLAMIDQYIDNLRRLKAIGFDAGTEEAAIAAGVRRLERTLTDYGIAHQAEVYEGNHTNRVAERIEKTMLPFFSRSLAFR
ncbi:MAG: esterase [Bryobacteraceae bacterium]|nr:esterase [Bryobacteraceae bacterium]